MSQGRRQQNRNAFTMKAITRRIRDAGLNEIDDERERRGRRFEHTSLMWALMLGMVNACLSLRAVETLTASMGYLAQRATGICGRISDSKLRDTLLSLTWPELRAALIRYVKAEHRRGALKPDRLPFGVLAIDGKALAKVGSWAHRFIQKVAPSAAEAYGLARVHRATLVSSKAAVVVDQRPIEGDTNEIGALPAFLRGLFKAYSRTNLFEVILADAGNSSKEVMKQIAEAGYGFFLRVKMNHGDLFSEAQRQFSKLSAPECEVSATERGATVTYRMWRITLGGWLGWEHVRQVVHIQRIVEKPGKEPREGNRYFCTNLQPGRLPDSKQWLTLARCYWRCENEQHWTSDVFWGEDRTRTPWTTDPEAIYVCAFLRVMALNVVAVLRAQCRRSWEPKKRLPWAEALKRVLIVLRAPLMPAGETLPESAVCN